MKKSGLGDSPIFGVVSNSSATEEKNNEPTTNSQKVRKAQNRSNVQMNKRSDEQPFNRSNVQVNNRSGERDYRVTKRNSYDLYIDQIHFIDDESVNRTRQTGTYVGKSDILREMIDFYISKKKK